jgi:hypothetical protein
LIEAFEAEVAPDGILSETERGLIRQAVSLTMTAEQMEAGLARGEPIDADQLIRISGTVKRILGSIGAKSDKRQAASGKDPLEAHIAAKYGNRSAANLEADTEDADEFEASDDAEEITAAAE